MSNVTSVNNYFPTAFEGFSTTISATLASGAATVPLTSMTGLTNGAVFVGLIEPKAAKEQVFTGTVHVASGSIINVVWTKGSNTIHTAGATVVDYVTSTAFNMITQGILREHLQSGQHGDIHATSVTSSGPGSFSGLAIGAGGTMTGPAEAIASSLIGVNKINTTNGGTAGGSMNTFQIGTVKVAWGTTDTISMGATTQANVTVIWPLGYFSAVPWFQVGRYSSSGGANLHIEEAAGPTSSQTSINSYNPNGFSASQRGRWIAIGS